MIKSHLLGAHVIAFSPLIKLTAPSGLVLVLFVLVPWVSVTLEGSLHLFLHPCVCKITTVYSP